MRGEGTRKTKVAVVGMGPVGQMLAVHLHESGQEVIVYNPGPEKAHRIRKEGIRLEGKINMHAVFRHVLTKPEDVAALEPDILFFAVKAYQLEEAALAFEKVGYTDCFAVSAQNGIDVEQKLYPVFGEANCFRMVVNFAGNHLAPNIIRVNFFNPPNYIASVDDTHAGVAQEIAGWLSGVGLDTVAVDSFELLKRVWEKTILNASLSALCGISQQTIREAMEFPQTLEVIEQTIMESVEVAKVENIHFEDDFIRKCLRYLRKAGDHFPSLAVDVFHKRPTEIEFFNGKIVEYGKKHYVKTHLHLSFTNLIQAITDKNVPVIAMERVNEKKADINENGSFGRSEHFMGIDLGSSFTKIVVLDAQGAVAENRIFPTLVRDKKPLYDALQEIYQHYDIKNICASGYGRERFPDADITKTEIHCAARAAFEQAGQACNIIDIGAEDIKVITLDEKGRVKHFFMNDKCAAGTGAFLTEISEKAQMDAAEMSKMAAASVSGREINSFCTVFAKTEVMKWMFDQVPPEDIARGVYHSLSNRIIKLKTDPSLPVYLAGGVIAYHPFLKNILKERMKQDIEVLSDPQYVVAKGAAYYAMNNYTGSLKETKENTESLAS